MKKSKIKRYFRNSIFMVLMTVSGFILIPIFVILFILSILYLPFEFIIYKKSKYKNIKKYSYLYTLYYGKTIKIIKNFENNNIDYIFDDLNNIFIFKYKNENFILFIKSSNKKEKTRIVSNPMDKYLKTKYNITSYKYINCFEERELWKEDQL